MADGKDLKYLKDLNSHVTAISCVWIFCNYRLFTSVNIASETICKHLVLPSAFLPINR